MEQTIPRLVLAASEQFAGRTAIEDGDYKLPFDQLGADMLGAARAFMQSGIEPGDRVGVWAQNVPEWITAALGLQAAGAVLVPLNTRMKGREAAYVLKKSGAKMLFTVTDFLGVNFVEAILPEDLPDLREIVTLRGAHEKAVGWSDFLARASEVDESAARARAEALSPEDLSDIIFTSGTTGNPKGVMTAHGQNIRTFEAWSGVVGLREGDRYLIVNPFSHSFGYKAGWLSCFMRGATAVPQPVFDVPQVLERIGTEKISVLPGPPTLYQSILAHPDRPKYDVSVRLAVTGAAPVPVELIRQMREELGFETIITAYGLTETCGVVSICRPDDSPETISNTSGGPIPDVEVRLVDTEGNDVPVGEPGEVIVRGYNVMKGYFADEEETAKTIDPDGWMHTGDIAIGDDRGYLKITDRIKDMFISGGFNCYPAEIENLMYSSGWFAQVAVIGVPDERMGEVGMAFVVPNAGTDVDEAGILAWCKENMANYKKPRFVEVVDALPMNASGKVTKFVLREEADRILANRSSKG